MRTDNSGLFGDANESDKSNIKGSRERQRISNFLNQWGWEYNVDLVSQQMRISEDEVYKMNVTHFINKLSYLKDKGKFLIAINGNK